MREVLRFAGLLAAVLGGVGAPPALAQARNPFGVGISEGGGSSTGITGWLLAQQGWFEHQLSLGVRSVHMGGTLWPLITVGFIYGIFHAAGPGHGKAVLSAYMVANERALRRGIALSFAAAMLQGVVAVALIGIMTFALHATAERMKLAASAIETASFVAIAAVGLTLVWRKGRALMTALRISAPEWRPWRSSPTSGQAVLAFDGGLAVPWQAPALRASGGFTCQSAEEAHPLDCAHCHAPDPQMLTGATFDKRQAAATVLAAGLRPCSGAILVLVFAYAQGIFAAGVAAVVAMSVGVAATTATLASIAVGFKAVAMRLAARRSGLLALAAAGVEFVAACLVLGAGVLLLVGQAVLGGGGS